MDNVIFFKIFATGVAVSVMFSLILIIYRYYSSASEEKFDLKQSLYLLFMANGMISSLVFILVLVIEIVRYVGVYY
jgi:fumarate reductase subunit D